PGTLLRQRECAWLTPDCEPAAHFASLHVHTHHFIAGAHGDVRRVAVVAEDNTPRLWSDVDVSGDVELIRADLQDRQVVAVPVRDDGEPPVAPEGDTRGLLTG